MEATTGYWLVEGGEVKAVMGRGASRIEWIDGAKFVHGPMVTEEEAERAQKRFRDWGRELRVLYKR